MIEYDVAQICERGHVVNDSSRWHTGKNEMFCSKCGAPTMVACPACTASIRGASRVAGNFFHSERPSFCGNCGKPYPWTEEGIHAAKELARELEGLKESDREALSNSLDDIVRDTPRTQLAVLQVKKFLARAKGPAASALKDTLLPIATEAARKALLGA